MYLNSADTENSLNHLSNYIVSTENEKDYSVDYYVAKDQPIRYINAYSDAEQDPMYEECWEYEYDPSVFYNESGQTEIQTFTSNEPVTVFKEAGAYTMRLKVRDNPVDDNDALDEYRLWSGENSYEKVLMVHNRPIAELTIEVSENPNNNSTVIINEFHAQSTINAKIAYDIDKIEPVIQAFYYKDANPEVLIAEWKDYASKRLKTSWGREFFALILKTLELE